MADILTLFLRVMGAKLWSDMVRYRPQHAMNRPLLVSRFGFFAAATLLVSSLSSGCFAPSETSSASGVNAGPVSARCITAEEAERLSDQVLELVNLERANAELPPVLTSSTLTKIAGEFACRMIEDNFFGHKEPSTGYGPGERALAGKYAFRMVGENLAAGQETAAQVVRDWMESQSHAEIMLDPSWKEAGSAVRSGGEYGIYWVLELGDPAAE